MAQPAKTKRTRIKIQEVEKRTGAHRQTIWRWYCNDQFPPPHYIGRDRCWYEDEIDRWEAEQLARPDAHRRPTVNESIASHKTANA